MKLVRLAVWLAGVALCATLLVGAIDGGWPFQRVAFVSYSVAVIGITIGVIVWQLRPDSRTGILLTALPIAGVLGDLRWVFDGSAVAVTVGSLGSQLGPVILGQLVLSYPTGRLRSGLDRVVVGIAWAWALSYGLLLAAFFDPRPQFANTILEFRPHALPFTHLGWFDAGRAFHWLDLAVLPLAVVFLALLVRKVARATPGGRRVILPLCLAAALAALQYVVQLAVFGRGVNTWLPRNTGWFWIVTLSSLAIPVSLAAGMLWGRRARASVADFVVALERTPPGAVRDALARTLGDPTLELALWLPDQSRYVDADGRPLTLPEPAEDRAVTVLGPPEAPVAALIHDPTLLDRRALLHSAAAAARLALENERLHAELRAQLTELRASSARIVSAGDDERRRLERNLHDGAQQRLLSLGLALQLARARLGPDSDGAADLLAEADAELRAALDELRDLAQGLHPALLTERGLGPALRSLAERSPVAVSIARVPSERLPAPTEAASYFLVSEALTNVAKYARASRVSVNVARVDSRLLIDVDDDGVGGADPARGSGLRGLADRVHALDGRLDLESAPGHGTHVHAEIPCV
jgi:signal transduction histidine kinase